MCTITPVNIFDHRSFMLDDPFEWFLLFAGMAFGVYVAARFCPAGHGTMVGVLNCFVHSVMYGYYLYSALDENVKTSIWWKKHITQIQLIQFLLLGLHFSAAIFVTDCVYPKLFCIVMAIQNLFMMFMFGDFYRRAYLRKKEDWRVIDWNFITFIQHTRI